MSAAAASGAVPESDPILCPACAEHFRGTQWPSQATHVPYMLACSHTLCFACADAAELAQTDDNDAVCPICTKKITPGGKVLNQSMADFSESVFRGNKWDDESHDDEVEEPRPVLPEVDPTDPTVIAARAKMQEFSARCLYGAKKMAEARDRIQAAKKRLQERLEASTVTFEANMEALRQKIIAHRDATIAEAQRLVTERTAILQAQIAELRASAQRLRDAAAMCDEAIASGDAAKMASAHESALAIQKSSQVDTKPRVSPLVDIITKTEPLEKILREQIRVSLGVDAAKSPVTGNGLTGYITGDSAEARANNVINVTLKDEKEMLLTMLTPEDAYVVIGGVPSKSQQQLDESVEISVEKPVDGELKITYVMKDASIKELKLRVDVAGIPLAGSPYTLKASN